MTVKVSAKFDAGNVEVIASRVLEPNTCTLLHTNPRVLQVVDVSDPKNIQLKIRPDPYCKGDDITHFQ